MSNNKQTLEEVALILYPENWQSIMDGQHDSNLYERNAFIKGAKWQQERMFSEEEVEQMINSFEKLCYKYQSNKDWFPSKKSEWFEQFKKKQQ